MGPRGITYQHGFSLVEVMLVVVVLGVLGAIAVPNLRDWSRNYQMKSASTDLYSYFQFAKIGAVKQNKSWTVVMNLSGITGYEIRDGAGKVVKRIDLGARYQRSVLFSSPARETSTTTFTINPNGSSNTGFVYLSDAQYTSYYRVGFPLANGLVQLQKWRDSQWE